MTLNRFYSSPIVHCPGLCPYHPPSSLFLDEYDPEQEEAAESFCLQHCPRRSSEGRPCVAEFHRRQTATVVKHHKASPASRSA